MYKKGSKSFVFVIFYGALALLSLSFSVSFTPFAIADSSKKPATKTSKTTSQEQLIEAKPPPLSDEYFPCSDCHEDLEPNPKRRVLEDDHEDIVLKHDEEHRWCLDCHDLKNRDKLHLASGELVDFSESYKLCGQCHGPKLRDWKLGIHGKRSGSWSGKKQYLLCVHCHYSHAPKFKPLKPMPPPTRPEDLYRQK